MNTVIGKLIRQSAKQKRRTSVLSALTGFAVLCAALHTGSAMAQSNSYGTGYSDSLTRKIYGGIGFGASRLEPDTSQVDGVDVNNRVNGAGQVMLGFDLNKWLSFEGHAAELGAAGLSPQGEINYQTFGLSALAYVGKNRHHYNRRGLSGFGRVGYGFLRNTPSDGVDFEQINNQHLLLGAGLEYSTRMGLGLRAEAVSFDTDVLYAQLSVLYRLGKRRSRPPQQIVEAPPAPVIIEEPVVLPPIPAVVVAPSDSDVDGIFDEIDQCPTTAPGVPVDSSGCALFNGVIEGVNFNSGSADLTQNAQGILSGVVSKLNSYPSVRLSIMAHTDDQGAADANMQLSRQRARSVAKYLVQNGVSVQRLNAYGFGEDRPIDTNDTQEGRLRNRRVEFQAQ